MSADMKKFLKTYSSLANSPLEEGRARVLTGTVYNKPVFYIIMRDWDTVVSFRDRDGWKSNIALAFIYRFSNYQTRIPEEMIYDAYRFDYKMWPPVLVFDIPQDKLHVISALRYVNSQDRNKLVSKLKLNQWDELEQEILSRGIGRALKK